MVTTKNHPYNKKDSGSYLFKLSPHKRFTVLTLYLQFLNWKSSFTSVKHLAANFHINPKRPSKIKKNFDNLWYQLYPWKPINYKINIFQERFNITIHKNYYLSDKKLNLLSNFIKTYNRAWWDTYSAKLSQQNLSQFIIPKSTFNYYKPIICSKLWIKYKKKSYCLKKEASNSKSFFNKLYKQFDFIFNLDWKSLEDIVCVQNNPSLSSYFKRISQVVEIQSGAIIKLATEKSHNKTNAFIIIKEIVETCKTIFGNNTKLLFITDAWSEYLSNKKLRGLFVSELDNSQIATYLKQNNSDLLITRFKQDNWYVENKNKYIELACLDNPNISKMDRASFIQELQSYMDLNNSYLKGSSKNVYRWLWITPKKNLVSRFGKQKTDRFLANLSVNQIESKHRLSGQYDSKTIFSLTQYFYPFLPIFQPFIYQSKKTFPIRLDSPKKKHNLTLKAFLISEIFWRYVKACREVFIYLEFFCFFVTDLFSDV